MNKLITLTSITTILIMSAVLVLSGLKGYGEEVNQKWIDMAANSMYVIVVISCLLIVIKEYQLDNKLWIVLFSLPLDLIILSLILPLFGIKMHPIILFIFDVYVLIIFSVYLGYQYKTDAIIESKTQANIGS